eukprot:45325_1
MSDVFPYEDDEDAKADELPSDEEGDPMTRGGPKAEASNNNNKPKTPPPVLQAQKVMVHGPNSGQMIMRLHSNHVPSKTVPLSLPQFWTCSVCTFAENSLLAPVCNVCGSLPPLDKTQSPSQNNINPPQKHPHPSHVRTVSEHIPNKALNKSSNVDMLPSFLEDNDDLKDEQQPPRLQQQSIVNVVTLQLNDNIIQNERDMKRVIMDQTNAMSSKKELQIELYSVKMTLQRKMKLHSTRVIAFNKQKSKLKLEHDLQSALWNRYYILLLRALCAAYFNKLFALIDHRIEIEKLYLECYQIKLDKVGIAYDKLDETIDVWDMKHMREYVQNTLCNIANIRTSSELQEKEQMVEKLKEKINKMETKYEEKKALLNKSKVEHKKRAARITLYLKTVMNEFNARNKNIKLDEKNFCRADVQENFNSFLLDQRVETGKMVKDWCDYLEHKKAVLLKDIWIFIERVITMFCAVYDLEKTVSSKYEYREYCMRFAYVAVLNLEMVDGVIQKLVQSQSGRKEYQSLCLHAEYALFVHLLRLKYKLK